MVRKSPHRSKQSQSHSANPVSQKRSVSAKKRNARILFFDLETTNLVADFGRLLCIGYKWSDRKSVKVPAAPAGIDYVAAEKRLVRDFLKVYKSADIICTYNGKRFDVPYLQAKALEHGFGVLPSVPHVDLYYTVKHGLRISRKSLQNAAYYLGLTNEKSPVEGRIWVAAMMGQRKALKYIVDHCRADVLVLEELYHKIKGLVRQHPYVKGYGPCRFCGSTNLQSRGPIKTKYKGEHRRVWCKDCLNWDQQAITKKEEECRPTPMAVQNSVRKSRKRRT
jgi:uncharacterized protein YprB with RNaseH-like and TPR domain